MLSASICRSENITSSISDEDFTLGSIKRHEDRLSVAIGEDTLALTGAEADTYQGLSDWVDQQLIVGIRPEAFSVAVSADDRQHALTASITHVEYLGSVAQLHFARPTLGVSEVAAPELNGLADSAAGGHRFTAVVGSEHDLTSGQSVHLAVDWNHVHFFDPVTHDAMR